MQEDIEKAVVEFTNYAAKVYSWLFNQFSDSIRQIDRNEAENVFKMQVSKYSLELKKKLEQQVNLLAESYPETHGQIKAVLSEKISYYLQAFWRKCTAL
jgi:hypothetical protein